VKRGSWRALLALALSLAGLLVTGLPASAASVPVYGQRAARWAHQSLGSDPVDTIGSAGCALTAAAMIQAGFGYPIAPDALNRWLSDHGGYIQNDLLLWRTAVGPTGGAVRWKWMHVPGMVAQLRTDDQDINDTPTAEQARQELDTGNLLVAEVRLYGGMHFVVLTGHQGDTFTINDPWFADQTTLQRRYGPYASAVYSAQVYYRP
jgi:peptidase C39-like protein